MNYYILEVILFFLIKLQQQTEKKERRKEGRKEGKKEKKLVIFSFVTKEITGLP